MRRRPKRQAAPRPRLHRAVELGGAALGSVAGAVHEGLRELDAWPLGAVGGAVVGFAAGRVLLLAAGLLVLSRLRRTGRENLAELRRHAALAPFVDFELERRGAPAAGDTPRSDSR